MLTTYGLTHSTRSGILCEAAEVSYDDLRGGTFCDGACGETSSCTPTNIRRENGASRGGIPRKMDDSSTTGQNQSFPES